MKSCVLARTKKNQYLNQNIFGRFSPRFPPAQAQVEMPAKWTSDEQEKWLWSRFQDFLLAQNRQATTPFFKKTHIDFLENWPIERELIPALEDGDEKSLASERKKRRKVSCFLIWIELFTDRLH